MAVVRLAIAKALTTVTLSTLLIGLSKHNYETLFVEAPPNGLNCDRRSHLTDLHLPFPDRFPLFHARCQW